MIVIEKRFYGVHHFWFDEKMAKIKEENATRFGQIILQQIKIKLFATPFGFAILVIVRQRPWLHYYWI